MMEEKILKQEILRNEGRISSLKHNLILMNLQRKALIKQNKKFREELRRLPKQGGKV